jgi:hypothetical protein
MPGHRSYNRVLLPFQLSILQSQLFQFSYPFCRPTFCLADIPLPKCLLESTTTITLGFNGALTKSQHPGLWLLIHHGRVKKFIQVSQLLSWVVLETRCEMRCQRAYYVLKSALWSRSSAVKPLNSRDLFLSFASLKAPLSTEVGWPSCFVVNTASISKL